MFIHKNTESWIMISRYYEFIVKFYFKMTIFGTKYPEYSSNEGYTVNKSRFKYSCTTGCRSSPNP